MQRREFLEWLGLGGADAFLRRYWPRDGLWNECALGATPAELLADPQITACWEGIEPAQVWDAHVHLIGTGDNGSGVWVNPRMRRLRHPWQYAQFEFYLNAACADHASDRDGQFVTRLLDLLEEHPPGVRALLLAFDYRHDRHGVRDTERSAFHTPNAYAAQIARRHPERLGWIASVHPYREDVLEALEKTVADGACAIKWLPAAMGMDPGSSRCDAFYAALIRHDLPLLVHCGTEYAVHGGADQYLGNPLPGIVPLVSPGYFAERGWLNAEQTRLLRAIRRHNPLLFDFLLKRMLRFAGRGLMPEVFMTRRHFARP